jgi:hypothetical protein
MIQDASRCSTSRALCSVAATVLPTFFLAALRFFLTAPHALSTFPAAYRRSGASQCRSRCADLHCECRKRGRHAALVEASHTLLAPCAEYDGNDGGGDYDMGGGFDDYSDDEGQQSAMQQQQQQHQPGAGPPAPFSTAKKVTCSSTRARGNREGGAACFSALQHSHGWRASVARFHG